jgi:hypothetical protein
MKAVIHHLPHNTPAVDIFDGLVSLASDVINIKQMIAIHRSPSKGSKTIKLPLFLTTLPRMAKSQEIFQLPSLCHIANTVEAYRAQNDLTQCHNCQQFGHIWANCKQPPCCLWCGEGSPAQGVPREREYIFHTNMLQLLAGGKRKTPSCQLSGLQTAEEEIHKKVTKDTQDYNEKGVLF